jgi:DNA-directed RNA polymerase specialized sigma subunit
MLQRTFSAPVYVLKYISLEVSGEREVARTLDDYLRGSARANSPSVARARSVFDQAYAIARQVAELREKHHVTQLELAEKTGLSQAQVSRIER